MSIKKFKFSEEDIRFLYNELRKSSILWKGREECFKNASKNVFVRWAKNGNPVYKLHWQCAHCKKWYKKKSNLEVDHITEIGGVTSFNGDWNEMIFKIMPRPVSKYLQCLCIWCHMKKTNKYNAANIKWERKK